MLHDMYTAYHVVCASVVSSNTLQYVRIDVLTSVTVKTTGLCNITMCSLYEFSGISEDKCKTTAQYVQSDNIYSHHIHMNINMV